MLLGMVEETELAFFLRTGDIGQNPGGSLCTSVEEGTGQGRTSQARSERGDAPGETPRSGTAGPPWHLLPEVWWEEGRDWHRGDSCGDLKNTAASSLTFRAVFGVETVPSPLASGQVLGRGSDEIVVNVRDTVV